MKKYFVNEDSELCYPLKHFKDEMKENGIDKMTVIEAKIVRGGEYFFCIEYQTCGEKNGTCNKLECSDYSPRNGKSGICKHTGYMYECTDTTKTIKLKK
jgi:hypothetical protein